MRLICRRWLVGLICVAFSGSALSQHGWYMGMELGVARALRMDVDTGGLDDWSTIDVSAVRCDLTLNPDRVQVSPGACSDEPLLWGPLVESFDGGSGILAAAALGYRRGNLRVEGEYFYRTAAHDSTDVPYDPAASYDPLADLAYDTVEDAVDDVLSHNIFANLYRDFPSDSRWTPYVGFGVGVASVSVEYRTLWQRTHILEDIVIFDPDGERGEELNRTLLGATTTGSEKLRDTLFGVQALAGLDYHVGETVTVGLKFRWARFGEFDDDAHYERLRGHASVAGNPPVPVGYYVQTDDIEFVAVGIAMRYQF